MLCGRDLDANAVGPGGQSARPPGRLDGPLTGMQHDFLVAQPTLRTPQVINTITSRPSAYGFAYHSSIESGQICGRSWLAMAMTGTEGLLTVAHLRAEHELPRRAAADELLRLAHAVAWVQRHRLQRIKG